MQENIPQHELQMSVLMTPDMANFSGNVHGGDLLKLTAKDMKANGLIDDIIKEPLGGAHRNREAVFESVKKAIEETYKKLSKLSVEKLIEKRMDKYTSYGVYK